ncbi:MAG: nucleotide exchange factor GrpE, partial [Candidatus Magasanikbacteria bacterium]|nr:nucleotide exchange factor GrpE [Candidatus Magasanikbacteria bacterium]
MSEEKKQIQNVWGQIFPEPTVGPLIYNEKDEVLLIRSPKWGEKWHIPGGHIELGETSEEALKREIREETGLEIDNIEFIGWQDAVAPEFFHKKKHFIFLDFCARMAGGEITKSEEMTEYVWIGPEKAFKELPIDPYTIKTIEFYLNHLEKNKDKSQEYLNNWKRALADYDNLKKETAKEKEAMGGFARVLAAMEFAGVYENLKKALNHEVVENNFKSWKEGVEHVKNQFAVILKENGIEE